MSQIVYGMPRSAYDALDRANCSKLKLLAKSPAHFRYGSIEEREDTDALKLGRLVDLAVFEPHVFDASVALWSGSDRRTKEGKKAWADFEAANAGKEIITSAEMEEILLLSNAVVRDPIAKRYVTNGKPQITCLWEHEIVKGFAIEMKARLDYETADFLVDLKTARDASPSGFGRQAWNLEYHMQAAIYSDGYFAATGVRKPFAFVVAEKEAPHVVQVYHVPDGLISIGREEYTKRLAIVASCRLDSRWPGYAEGELLLQAPAWANTTAVSEEPAHVE